MGAFFSLELVQRGVEIIFSYSLQGIILPNQHGGCALLPKVMDQLDKLESRKAIDGQDFPGSNLFFSPLQRSQWMADIHETRPIGQIIWPGTHHSATKKIGTRLITRAFGKRQSMSVYRQLLNGVRALDIRIQQDRRVCSRNLLCGTTVDDVISDIKLFLEERKFEIIFLEIRTERGYADPKDFETYLVNQLGDLLIHQDDRVFSQSILGVLPRRIICVWKPNNSPRPVVGGPIWSDKYLKVDEIDTEMPLTKFQGNINKLKDQVTLMDQVLLMDKFFYKVENTMTPQTSSVFEWLLVWPKHANVVSKRINDFARLFLAKCHAEGVIDRLQIFSVDFVDEDFISACIGLNHGVYKQESRAVEITCNVSVKSESICDNNAIGSTSNKYFGIRRSNANKNISDIKIKDNANKNISENNIRDKANNTNSNTNYNYANWCTVL